MTLLTIILLVVFCMALIKRFHQNYVQLKFKYRVFALRDRLRRMVLMGDIDIDDQLFDYYDKSFSKAISKSYYLTLFHVSLLAVKYYNQKEIIEFEEYLNEQTGKNEKLRKIHNDYLLSLREYLVSQHYMSIYLFILPVAKLVIGTHLVKKKFNQLLEGILIFPETSHTKRFIAS